MSYFELKPSTPLVVPVASPLQLAPPSLVAGLSAAGPRCAAASAVSTVSCQRQGSQGPALQAHRGR